MTISQSNDVVSSTFGLLNNVFKARDFEIVNSNSGFT